MNMKRATRHCTAALSLALAISTCYAADGTATAPGSPSAAPQAPQPAMTGKQKATAVGAGTGAVAGALVGGPIGAIIGAGAGAVVGNTGTDASGHVRDPNRRSPSQGADSTVLKAQAALNDQGFEAGTVDGRLGPNTENAIRRFQTKSGLTESGTLDSSTLSALGVNN